MLALLGVLLLSVPTAWSGFSSRPFYPWLFEQVGFSGHLAFSPSWMITPIGSGILLIILWGLFSPTRKETKKNKRFRSESSPTPNTVASPPATAKPTAPLPNADVICSKISELAHHGDQMLSLPTPQDLEARFNRWTKTCEDYLIASLDHATLRLFQTRSLYTPYNPINIDADPSAWQLWDLYERISSHVMRLREIIDKVKTGELPKY